jgi:hypothetical protein
MPPLMPHQAVNGSLAQKPARMGLQLADFTCPQFAYGLARKHKFIERSFGDRAERAPARSRQDSTLLD